MVRSISDKGPCSAPASSVDTSLLGHSYYGDNRSIVSDLFALFENHKAPPRFGLREQATATGDEYWLFRP